MSDVAAVRTLDGIEEEARFVGAGAHVFQMIHRPLGETSGGVLICSSLHAEQLSNYRAEVLLGRALAQRGIAVLRFHYAGTGHSAGDGSGLTHHQMVADARDALDRLRDMVGDRIAAYGARWGAVVAAHAVDPSIPVALWQPALDGRSYWREVTRFDSIHRMREGDVARAADDELEKEGYFTALGYRIHRELYDSMLETRLGLAEGGLRRLLLVQMTKRSDLQRSYRALEEEVLEAGGNCDVRLFSADPAWWLLKPPPPGLSKVIDETAEWLQQRIVNR